MAFYFITDISRFQRLLLLMNAGKAIIREKTLSHTCVCVPGSQQIAYNRNSGKLKFRLLN